MYIFAFPLLLAAFVGCDNSDPTDDGPIAPGIQPVSPDAELTAFFKEYLPKSSYSVPLPDFNFGDVDHYDTVCLVINSDDEFRTIAPFATKLPSIEFDKYTLIIGQHPMGDPGYSLEKQGMDAEPDKMKLSLVYKSMEGSTPAMEVTFYYWGLYPKLPQKPVTVNIISN